MADKLDRHGRGGGARAILWAVRLLQHRMSVKNTTPYKPLPLGQGRVDRPPGLRLSEEDREAEKNHQIAQIHEEYNSLYLSAQLVKQGIAILVDLGVDKEALKRVVWQDQRLEKDDFWREISQKELREDC